MRAFLEQFQNCPDEYRPRIRWWLPGSSLDDAELIRELDDMHAAGIGAVEISCQNQNGMGWGSAEWFAHFKVILREAGKRHMKVDFMPAVHWVTNAADLDFYSSGSEKELVQVTEQLHLKKQKYVLKLLTPDSQLSEKNSHDFNSFAPVSEGILIGATIRNMQTDHVEILSEGKDAWTDFQNADKTEFVFLPEEAGNWELNCFWEIPTGNKIRGIPAIDHFNSAGSSAVIQWWDTQFAEDPELEQLIRDHAEYLFLDSLELGTEHYWTHDMLKEFNCRRGYDLLPLLHEVFQPDGNQQVKNDYAQVLSELLSENYFTGFGSWCHRHGIRLRAQSCYGILSEMAQVSMAIDCPETERLGFTDSTDGYRNQAGTVHIQGKKIYSSELAPVLGAAYKQTWKQLLWHTCRCFASGVNQAVWHGYAYRTDAENPAEQWPGYSPMSPIFCEELGSRVPSWKYSRTVNDAVARQQLFLRQGTPKTDLAIYHHSYHENNMAPDYYPDDSLEICGYSYDYISPALLSENSEIRDGTLFPSGPAYKALLFVDQARLSRKAVSLAEKYAERGLPVIFIGSLPTQGEFLQDEGIADRIQTLVQQKRVYHAADMKKALKLMAELHIAPAAAPRAPAGILTAHRKDLHADYYYLTAQQKQAGNQKSMYAGHAVDTVISLSGHGNVYRLDPWTGDCIREPVLRRTEDTVSIRLKLAQNDAALFLVTEEQLPAPMILDVGKPVMLTDWDIALETWHPDQKDHLKTVKENFEIFHAQLSPWDVYVGGSCSGTAVYRTSFEAEAGNVYLLRLGKISDAYEVWLNGRRVPGGNVIDPSVTLRGTVTGTNQLEIRVGSNLYGIMKSCRRTCSDLLGDHLPPMPGIQAQELETTAGLSGPVELSVIKEESVYEQI